MQTLTTTADQIQPGDTITHVEGNLQRNPTPVLTITPGWVNASIYANDLTGGIPRLLLNDTPVVVRRPETAEERNTIAEQMYRWMLMLTHNPFDGYRELNPDHLNLLWLMYGREGERDGAFTDEIQARLDADYDERCTIPPC